MKDDGTIALRARGARGGRVLPLRSPPVSDGDPARVEADPHEGAVVAPVLAEREAGRTYREIAEVLTKHGDRPRGRSWHPTTPSSRVVTARVRPYGRWDAGQEQHARNAGEKVFLTHGR